ncbi:hypothetical protein GCM10022247_30500 [Allokutzneria multivorans]|uniref:Uncharacterized protein n=1 Tax=Allokutzneria multivorans TaxID=1142134 RepID=A0ABP7S539_9PSEU
MIIDCDGCPRRGPGCHDCVLAVLIGVPPELVEGPEPQVMAPSAVELPVLRLIPLEPLRTRAAERSADDAERARRQVG